MTKDYKVWQSSTVAQNFLEGVRGAIPLAGEQIECVMRLLRLTQSSLDCFLDLGCGNGILGKSIHKYYPAAQGIFLDLSETMLAAAQQATAYGKSEFVLADFGKLGWQKSITNWAPFDVVVSGFAIHHQPDEIKQRIYKEIYDLLKVGGIFLNLEHVASKSKLGANAFDELFVDCLYQYHQQLGHQETREEIDAEYYSREDKTANILAPVDLQCEWLKAIGFKDVDCFMKIYEIALFGGVKY